MTSHDTGLPQQQDELGQRLALSDRRLSFFILGAGGFFFFLLLLPVLLGETFLAGDLLTQSLPFRKFYADALHHHESFLWSPSLYGGFYLHGEGQAGMMHPFHLLLYRFLPLTIAFGMEILSSYAFLFGGCFLFFKCWKLGTPAALFGSFLFTFGGTNLVLLEHLNGIAVVAHLPWALLAIQRVFEAGERRTRALWLSALAMLIGSEVLLGHPQSVYFCALVEGGYAIYLMAVKARWARFLEVLVALGFGLLIGGAQLLPTAVALQGSVRSEPSVDFLGEMSLQPQELLQWVNPLLWKGFRYNQFRGFYNLFIYCGGIVTLLLFAWLLSRKDLDARRRKLRWFLAVIGFGSLFLALGKYNLVFPLYARLPVLGLFRAPARYTVLTDFAISAGAALALEHLRNCGGRFPVPAWINALAWVCAVVSLGTVPFAFLADGTALFGLSPHLATPMMVAIGGLMVSAGALWFLALGRVPSAAGSWLAIFVLLDVICMQGMILLVHNKSGDPFQVASVPPVPAPGPVQVAGYSDQLLLLGYRLVDGYSGLEPVSPVPMRSRQYARITGARALREGEWRVLPDALPLARVRNHAVPMANRDALLLDSDLAGQAVLMEHPGRLPWIEEDLSQVNHFDFSKAALVEVPVALDAGASGSMNMTEEHPGGMTLVADVTGSMLGSTGTRFHSGWKVQLDGKPQEILRVDGSLLGFVVPVGHHTIECSFEPDDFRYGELASLIGVAGMLLYLVIIFARARKTI